MDPDAAVLLADFVSSLENLPLEVHHILQEIGHKEARVVDFEKKITQRDQGIQKHARPVAQGGLGLLVPNPKEESSIVKARYVRPHTAQLTARSEYDRAEQVSKDKLALADRGVALLSRHLVRLSAQLELLTANVPPLPLLPSFTPVPPTPTTAAQYNQAYAAGAPAHQQYQQANPGYAGPGSYGMGTGSTGQDRKALQANAQSSSQQLQLQLQAQQLQSHSNAAYGYASPPPQAASARAHRPSRLSNVNYPVQTQLGGMAGQHLTPQQQQMQQIQQQQIQQQMHQQQIHQQQARQIQLQQQAQQQAQQQQSGGHGGHQVKRRKKEEEAADEEGEEEGVDGEDSTPYCFCQRPSFGEMIGCDSEDCDIEWYHLSCVGLKSTPEGSWYCGPCESRTRKRGRK